MDELQAMAVLKAAGVAQDEAQTVVRRLDRIEGSRQVDGAAMKMLMRNLTPETQEALVALAMPHDRLQRTSGERLTIVEMFADMLDDQRGIAAAAVASRDDQEDLCNVATVNDQWPTYEPVKTYPSPPPPAKPRPDPPPSSVSVGSWRAGKLIGSGSYGQVFQGLTETGALIAIKTLDLPVPHEDEALLSRSYRENLEETHQEIELLSTLQHENIVKYLGSEVDRENFKIHIFQEWVPGGSLSATLKNFGKFDDGITRRYLTHVLRGLIFLHSQRVVHRDIKGENVLISDQGIAKLADFGASKRLGDEGTLMQTGSLRGTPYYMAPEQMTGKAVGRKCDVWAVGGLALLCATGDPPWKKSGFKTPYALMMAVAKNDNGPPLGSYELSPELLDFISICFTRESGDRPSARVLGQHPFIGLVLPDSPPPSPALPPTPGATPQRQSMYQRLKTRMISPSPGSPG